MTPIFESPHRKRSFLFVCLFLFFLFWAKSDSPLFLRNLTPNAPSFLSPVGTCTSLSSLFIFECPPPPSLLDKRKKSEHFDLVEGGGVYGWSQWSQLSVSTLAFPLWSIARGQMSKSFKLQRAAWALELLSVTVSCCKCSVLTTWLIVRK